MKHLSMLMIGLLATAFAVVAAQSTAQERKGDHGKHAAPAHYMECAKACDDCARVCDECSNHCAHMVAEGMKDHLRTLKTCQDCATVCSTASRIVARVGPFSDTICTACAEACKRCGDACDKHPDDPMMKKCAAECRKCEAACREMLKHAGHNTGTR